MKINRDLSICNIFVKIVFNLWFDFHIMFSFDNINGFDLKNGFITRKKGILYHELPSSFCFPLFILDEISDIRGFCTHSLWMIDCFDI